MLVYTSMHLRRSSATTTAWLSITPEPERLLPCAVATLLVGGRPPAAAIERERERLDAAVRRARGRAWSAYLRRARRLAEQEGGVDDPHVARARRLAVELIDDH